ncbi:MAG: hypothetical protein MMC33_000520 [Icmadophila ericetorum]|nr:hypothetical protein [Icmadophila ericetorum]
MNCKACSYLEFPPPNFIRQEPLVLADIKRNALNSTCRTCSMLFRGIEKLVGAKTVEQFQRLVIHAGGEPRQGPMRADLLLPYGTDDFKVKKRKLKLQFYVHPDNPGPWEAIGPALDIAHHGLEDSCVNLALGWLENCTAQKRGHEDCQIYEASPLPTRVIRVGKTNLELCLHISKPNEKGRYVALSHCWGGISPLITSLASFNKHVQNIRYSHLPQTFRNAIEVTRRLDVEYLWIDSLCIIQDSMEDWVSEAAHMALVYENSYVTVAADAAVDSATGFLAGPARHPGPMVSVDCATHDEEQRSIVHVREKGALAWQMPFHSWDPKEGKLFGDQSRINGIKFDPGTLFSDSTAPRSKLSTRGWVFQEQILAPRTLHFSESELAWECHSAITCECSSFTQRRRRGGALLKGTIKGEMWKQIVAEYTALNLTFPKDRLPALSGLAQAMSRVKVGDEYLCGLWRKSLPVELLWCTVESIPRASLRLGKSYAPTWSWASITGTVEYSPKGIRVSDTFEILEIYCPINPDNLFGPLNGPAALLVSGVVVPIKRQDPKMLSNWQWVSPALPIQEASEGSKEKKELEGLRMLSDLWNDTPKPYLEDEGSSLYFFLMMGGPSGGYEVGCPHGLVLKRVGDGDGEGEDVYERVGYAQGSTSVDNDDQGGWSSDDSSDDVGVSALYAERAWDGWAALGEKKRLKIL